MSATCSHHAHTHDAGPRATARLRLTLGLVALYFLAELIGGWWTGSLALLADAGHMFSDMAAIVVSLLAATLKRRAAQGQQTFGYHRAESLAALGNGALLLLVSGGIVHEAWERLSSPVAVDGPVMAAIAVGGLVVNLLSLSLLHGDRHHDLNMRGAWLHVVGDALGSVGVIVAAAAVWGFGWTWADPVVSILVCILIAWSAWQLVREAGVVLMEIAPRDIDVSRVRRQILAVPGVESVHCLHVWTIASGLRAVSAHVVINEHLNPAEALPLVRSSLISQFPLEHITLQFEPAGQLVCPEAADGSCLIPTAGRLGEAVDMHRH